MLGEACFIPDPAVPARLASRDGEAIRDAAKAALIEGAVLPAAAVADLVARFDLKDAEELVLHLQPLAAGIARPPISEYFVGAVGLATSGEIVLGGNLEWPGAHLGVTLHGEGFVSIRAFQLGLTLSHVAVGEARPCGHCRQCLAEYAAADDLLVIDPLGHRLPLSELFPWAFTPADLEMRGADPAASSAVMIPAAPAEVAELLARAVGHSHAPYSGVKAAVVLEAGGRFVAGGVIESVAFNPTIQPVMAALVELVARGIEPATITRAWLAQLPGPVTYAPPTEALLASLGDASLSTLEARA